MRMHKSIVSNVRNQRETKYFAYQKRLYLWLWEIIYLFFFWFFQELLTVNLLRIFQLILVNRKVYGTPQRVSFYLLCLLSFWLSEELGQNGFTKSAMSYQIKNKVKYHFSFFTERKKYHSIAPQSRINRPWTMRGWTNCVLISDKKSTE